MEIDVREETEAAARARIRERVAGLDPGERATIRTTQDPAVALAQAEIVLGRGLDRTDERSGPEWDVRVTVGEKADGPPAFDVRELPPRRRHAVLTETFAALAPGDAFVLVNDHDPKPLYHELQSSHGDVVAWEYRDRDGGEWRVEIGKTGASGADTEGPVVATFDVREIPKEERHPTIHHRYANVADGDAIEVVAPHEPRPLRQEFAERYSDAFDWDVLERESGRCRVRITKGERGETGDTDAASSPGADAAESLAVTDELDVRDLPPAQRHEEIFRAYDGLDGGEAFVLVNDHDPEPLYHQFEAEAGAAFRWEYRQQSPGEFRVLIGKAAEADTEPASTSAAGNTEAPF